MIRYLSWRPLAPPRSYVCPSCLFRRSRSLIIPQLDTNEKENLHLLLADNEKQAAKKGKARRDTATSSTTKELRITPKVTNGTHNRSRGSQDEVNPTANAKILSTSTSKPTTNALIMRLRRRLRALKRSQHTLATSKTQSLRFPFPKERSMLDEGLIEPDFSPHDVQNEHLRKYTKAPLSTVTAASKDSEEPTSTRSSSVVQKAGTKLKAKSAIATTSSKKVAATAKAKPKLAAKRESATKKHGVAAKTKTATKKIPTVERIEVGELSLQPVEAERPSVPELSYGLDRVLFNAGVYNLQDQRTRVYNFDPYLQSIMPASEFDFDALKGYVTSSKDEALTSLARDLGKKYIGSTSSMTGVLSHFHFLLSNWRELNFDMLSKGFTAEYKSFTQLTRTANAMFLKYNDGVYAVDGDKEFASSTILSLLGQSMEKMLTLETGSFERYRKSSPDSLSQEERDLPLAYNYSTMGDFLTRSQLDAWDPRLPGTGMFDLKTRAVAAVRMEHDNYEEMRGYQIKGRFGDWESYEREYYDMMRSTLLKYSLQVRLGRMDGIFVTFHNTERIFGFQYLPLAEIDLALHGQSDLALGDLEFKLSLQLFNEVLNKATERFPGQSIRFFFETREATTTFMYIFAEPIDESEMEELQSRNDAEIAEFERGFLGQDTSADGDEKTRDWDDIRADVQQAMDRDGEETQKLEGQEVDVKEELPIVEGKGRDANLDAKAKNEVNSDLSRGDRPDIDVKHDSQEERGSDTQKQQLSVDTSIADTKNGNESYDTISQTVEAGRAITSDLAVESETAKVSRNLSFDSTENSLSQTSEPREQHFDSAVQATPSSTHCTVTRSSIAQEERNIPRNFFSHSMTARLSINMDTDKIVPRTEPTSQIFESNEERASINVDADLDLVTDKTGSSQSQDGGSEKNLFEAQNPSTSLKLLRSDTDAQAEHKQQVEDIQVKEHATDSGNRTQANTSIISLETQERLKKISELALHVGVPWVEAEALYKLDLRKRNNLSLKPQIFSSDDFSNELARIKKTITSKQDQLQGLEQLFERTRRSFWQDIELQDAFTILHMRTPVPSGTILTTYWQGGYRSIKDSLKSIPAIEKFCADMIDTVNHAKGAPPRTFDLTLSNGMSLETRLQVIDAARAACVATGKAFPDIPGQNSESPKPKQNLPRKSRKPPPVRVRRAANGTARRARPRPRKPSHVRRVQTEVPRETSQSLTTDLISRVPSSDHSKKAMRIVYHSSRTEEDHHPLAEEPSPSPPPPPQQQQKKNDSNSPKPLLAMTLTIKSKLNGKEVDRPTDLQYINKHSASSAARPTNKNWTIEYSLEEVPKLERAWALYNSCKERRRKKFNDTEIEDKASNFYIERLRRMSREGRKWVEEEERKGRGEKIVV